MPQRARRPERVSSLPFGPLRSKLEGVRSFDQFLGPASSAGTKQGEARENDRLDRDDDVEKHERIRIERLRSAFQNNPSSKNQNVRGQECAAASRARLFV